MFDTLTRSDADAMLFRSLRMALLSSKLSYDKPSRITFGKKRKNQPETILFPTRLLEFLSEWPDETRELMIKNNITLEGNTPQEDLLFHIYAQMVELADHAWRLRTCNGGKE